MPGFGALAPFGLLEFSSEPTLAERVYESLQDATKGTFDVSWGTHVQASNYVRAIALGCARAYLRHAGAQRRPSGAVEMLPALEDRFGVTPPRGATHDERVEEVALRKLVSRGPRADALLGACMAILGDGFVTLKTFEPGEVVTYPALPGVVGLFTAPERPHRAWKLESSFVESENSPFDHEYSALGEDDGATMSVGDVLVIDGHDYEKAELFEVREVGVEVNRKWFRANTTLGVGTFGKPHGRGAPILSYSPAWNSTQRTIVVVGTPTAARNPAVRAKLFARLSRMVRGVTAILFVEDGGGSSVGPFTLGSSALGCVPIGTITWTA